MSLYTKLKFNKLSVMYDGDKDRDAMSKIRGFLFQDYITIMCLLQKQVKYVCSEYLEESKRYQRSCGESSFEGLLSPLRASLMR